MVDNVSKGRRSYVMSRIRSKGTKIERLLCRNLRANGYHFKRNYDALPGKPDLVFLNNRVCVFLDSCFWHACQKHFRRPKSNNSYWTAKIRRNKKRDRSISNLYKLLGWKALRFWEHEITKDNLYKVISRIDKAIKHENK